MVLIDDSVYFKRLVYFYYNFGKWGFTVCHQSTNHQRSLPWEIIEGHQRKAIEKEYIFLIMYKRFVNLSTRCICNEYAIFDTKVHPLYLFILFIVWDI